MAKLGLQLKDWITTAIAICALLLSAYNSYNIYLQRRDKKPRIRLKARMDHNHDFFVKHDPRTGTVTMEKDTAVVVKVENIGEREYNMKEFSFKPILRKCFPIQPNVRPKLSPESYTEASFRARTLLAAPDGKPRGGLIGRVEVKDHMGRRFRSQFFRITARREVATRLEPI